MELILAILAAVAAPVVVVAAKRGAEAARREREQRWGHAVPASTAQAGLLSPRAREAGGLTATARRFAGRPVAQVPTAPGRVAGAGDSALAAETKRPGSALPPAAPTRPPGTRAARHLAAGGTRRAAPSAASARPPQRPTPARPAPRAVDINTASVEELQALPGVGVRAAHRIVAHRERYGRFAAVSDLEEVAGFDHHRVGQLAPRATVSEASGSAAQP